MTNLNGDEEESSSSFAVGPPGPHCTSPLPIGDSKNVAQSRQNTGPCLRRTPSGAWGVVKWRRRAAGGMTELTWALPAGTLGPPPPTNEATWGLSVVYLNELRFATMVYDHRPLGGRGYVLLNLAHLPMRSENSPYAQGDGRRMGRARPNPSCTTLSDTTTTPAAPSGLRFFVPTWPRLDALGRRPEPAVSGHGHGRGRGGKAP